MGTVWSSEISGHGGVNGGEKKSIFFFSILREAAAGCQRLGATSISAVVVIIHDVHTHTQVCTGSRTV